MDVKQWKGYYKYILLRNNEIKPRMLEEMVSRCGGREIVRLGLGVEREETDAEIVVRVRKEVKDG